MESIDVPLVSDAPYRLPSRHPAAARQHNSAADNASGDQTSSSPPLAGLANASEIKRRQQALLVAYIIRLGR
jgi:hypothetical protein